MNGLGRMMVSLCVAAGAFLATFLGLGWHAIVCAVLAVALYFALDMLLTPRRKIGAVAVEDMVNGEALSAMLEEGQRDLHDIGSLANRIQATETKEQAQNLLTTGAHITAYLTDHPEKLAQARRFFTYYLKTTRKLLTRYLEMQQTGIMTNEIQSAMAHTSDVLPVLHKAYEDQFTRLMAGEVMDVDTEVAVLEQILRRDGSI